MPSQPQPQQQIQPAQPPAPPKQPSPRVHRLARFITKELKARYADPTQEAPASLRDMPTEMVFPALKPRDQKPSNPGAMAALQSQPPTPLEQMIPSPASLPMLGGPQAQPEMLNAPTQPQPAPQPGEGAHLKHTLLLD